MLDEEELDDDEGCTPFTQELKLSLGCPVLHLATPPLPNVSLSDESYHRVVPLLMQARIVLLVACADSSVKLITLPITPPSAAAKRNHTLGAQICDVVPASAGCSAPRAVALTWTSTTISTNTPTTEVPDRSEGEDLDLLIALSFSGVASDLRFFRFPMLYSAEKGVSVSDGGAPFRTLQLSSRAHHISFNPTVYPSPKHSQLLFADTKGALKVYDPLASSGLISFNTPFYLPKENDNPYPSLARQKTILDARWVSAGRAVLVLLEDGEWGVWNVDGGGPVSLANSTPTSLTNFAIRGFVGESSKADTSAASNLTSRTNHRLVPMTPNTRKVRQGDLFSGPGTNAAGNTHRGGISVAATTTSHGTPDDSVVLWHGNEAHHIPSLVSLWQQNINSGGREVGSLYGPGLVHLEGLNMSGEMFNGIGQFPPRSTSMAANLGNITHRDILVTGEYRFVIISTTRPQTPARSLFAGGDSGSPTTKFDMQLLEQGDLDLNGVDRLLDGMTGIERPNGFGKPKRVGFAR